MGVASGELQAFVGDGLVGASRHDQMRLIHVLARESIRATDFTEFSNLVVGQLAAALSTSSVRVIRLDDGQRETISVAGPVADAPPAERGFSSLIWPAACYAAIEIFSPSCLETPEAVLELVETVASLAAAVMVRTETARERKRAFEILESTPDFVGTMDADGTITYVNEAIRDLRSEKEAAEARSYEEYLPAWAVEVIQTEGLPTALRDGSWIGRSAFLTDSGSEIPVSQLVIAHRDSDGKVDYLSTVARDLTLTIETQRELAQWRELVNKAFHESPVGGALISPRGELLAMNPALACMLGLSPAEAIGRSVADVLHPEDLARVGTSGGSLLNGTLESFRDEMRLRRHDGTFVWGHAYGSPIRDVEGTLDYVIAQVLDIDAERQARERVRFQASLLDQVHNAVVATDLHGTITYWNRHAERMLGWSSTEVVGQPLSQLFTDGRRNEIAHFAKLHGSWEGEVQLWRNDGTKASLWLNESQVTDSEGQFSGLVGVGIDIESLREAERRADVQERIAESVLRSVHFPVAVLNSDGDITSVNHEWRRFAIANGGSPVATGEGVNYLDVCQRATDEPTAHQALTGIRDVLRGRQDSFSMEYPCHPPSKERWFELEATAMPGGGAVVAHWDITAEKQARRALEEVIEVKDRFIASISHELRTPLSVVVGLAEELRGATFSPDERQELLDLLADQAQETAFLVDDLLVAARLRTHTLTIKSSSASLAEAVNRVIAPWNLQGYEIGATVNETFMVAADPGRLRQIIRNLIKNAMRHGKPPIEVTAESHHHQTLLHVSDCGPGIPAEALPDLFEPYAVFSPADGRTESLGLGLPVSQALAQAMEGDLWFDSSTVPTTFTLALPTVPPPNGHP